MKLSGLFVSYPQNIFICVISLLIIIVISLLCKKSTLKEGQGSAVTNTCVDVSGWWTYKDKPWLRWDQKGCKITTNSRNKTGLGGTVYKDRFIYNHTPAWGKGGTFRDKLIGNKYYLEIVWDGGGGGSSTGVWRRQKPNPGGKPIMISKDLYTDHNTKHTYNLLKDGSPYNPCSDPKQFYYKNREIHQDPKLIKGGAKQEPRDTPADVSELLCPDISGWWLAPSAKQYGVQIYQKNCIITTDAEGSGAKDHLGLFGTMQDISGARIFQSGGAAAGCRLILKKPVRWRNKLVHWGDIKEKKMPNNKYRLEIEWEHPDPWGRKTWAHTDLSDQKKIKDVYTSRSCDPDKKIVGPSRGKVDGCLVNPNTMLCNPNSKGELCVSFCDNELNPKKCGLCHSVPLYPQQTLDCPVHLSGKWKLIYLKQGKKEKGKKDTAGPPKKTHIYIFRQVGCELSIQKMGHPNIKGDALVRHDLPSEKIIDQQFYNYFPIYIHGTYLSDNKKAHSGHQMHGNLSNVAAGIIDLESSEGYEYTLINIDGEKCYKGESKKEYKNIFKQIMDKGGTETNCLNLSGQWNQGKYTINLGQNKCKIDIHHNDIHRIDGKQITPAITMDLLFILALSGTLATPTLKINHDVQLKAAIKSINGGKDYDKEVNVHGHWGTLVHNYVINMHMTAQAAHRLQLNVVSKQLYGKLLKDFKDKYSLGIIAKNTSKKKKNFPDYHLEWYDNVGKKARSSSPNSKAAAPWGIWKSMHNTTRMKQYWSSVPPISGAWCDITDSEIVKYIKKQPPYNASGHLGSTKDKALSFFKTANNLNKTKIWKQALSKVTHKKYGNESIYHYLQCVIPDYNHFIDVKQTGNNIYIGNNNDGYHNYEMKDNVISDGDPYAMNKLLPKEIEFQKKGYPSDISGEWLPDPKKPNKSVKFIQKDGTIRVAAKAAGGWSTTAWPRRIG